MIERWSRDQVLALAPDAASQKAGQGVSAPGKWSGAGVLDDVLWGECKGSGSKPYRACVDLSEPAYRCSCPSRKFPCKHAVGLLLLWSSDGVAAVVGHPDWVAEWVDHRRERAEKQAAKVEAARERADQGEGTPEGAARAADAERRAAQREDRVGAGLAELERWLSDQIGQGVAGVRQTGIADWTDLAKRLVDAQAPGVATTIGRFSRLLNEEDWPERLLGEYALVHLLAVAHRRSADLPGDLRETVRSRIGFPVTRESVLASEPVRDHWDVIGSRDEEEDRLISRKVWLRGRSTGRPALVLSYAPVGQALDASLVTGTTIDADLVFYPGSSPLRALVAERHGAVGRGSEDVVRQGMEGVTGQGVEGVTGQDMVSVIGGGPPPGIKVSAFSGRIAEVLAGDPWTDSWPVVLADVVPSCDGGRILLAAESPDAVEGSGMPLHSSVGTPWRLLAVSGGRPVTVAAEWTPQGLRPLSTWDEEGQVVVL